MSILVLRPGMLASVQDLGRPGWRHLGICPGGALDTLALRLANRLVGNPVGAAGIELTMGHAELRFEAGTRIALLGDDFDARLDAQPLHAGWSVPVRAGQRLRLGGANRETFPPGKPGLRSWLAVAGGIDVPLAMGSRSTDLQAGFGGLEGRALRKGDRLPVGVCVLSEAQRACRPFGLRAPALWHDESMASCAAPAAADDGVRVLRVMPGPEAAQFSAAMRQRLYRTDWRITPQSNRMGSRLAGPAPLERAQGGDMLSSGILPGTVQVPPSGQPIILMGDAQTTGGYPRIAVVIRADLWKLAQAPLGGLLRLVPVDAAEALAAWQAQQRHLARVDQGLAAMGWPVAA